MLEVAPQFINLFVLGRKKDNNENKCRCILLEIQNLGDIEGRKKTDVGVPTCVMIGPMFE